MMLTTMQRGTLAIWCSSSPTSGTGSSSRSSSGRPAALPYSVFSRSACATGVDSSRARSLVTCTPPTGSCAVCSSWPSANTAMPVVPPPMSITVAPSSRSSSTSVASPAAIGAETSSAMSRSQRATQAPSERSAPVAASMTCSRAVKVSQMQAARIGHALGLVGREGQRQGVDRFAAVALGARAALGDDAADVALLHRAPADRPLHVEQPAFRLAAGEVDGDVAQPRVGHVLGLADGGADRPLGLVEIDDAAAAHALAALPAEAEHAQRAVGFAAGRSGRRSWWCRYPARRTGRNGRGAGGAGRPHPDRAVAADAGTSRSRHRSALKECGTRQARPSPSPLRGRAGVGGAGRTRHRAARTPHPGPPPQGGREVRTTPLMSASAPGRPTEARPACRHRAWRRPRSAGSPAGWAGADRRTASGRSSRSYF